MNKITAKYWKEDDRKQLKKVSNFKELRDIGFRVIVRMPQPVVQVCGPISTGGLGSIADNLAVFKKYIRAMQKEGRNVFDQMPFEPPIQRLRVACPDRSVERAILYEFYLPIFRSGFIAELVFMPNWSESIGACWEFAQGQRLGIKTTILKHPLV